MAQVPCIRGKDIQMLRKPLVVFNWIYVPVGNGMTTFCRDGDILLFDTFDRSFRFAPHDGPHFPALEIGVAVGCGYILEGDVPD